MSVSNGRPTLVRYWLSYLKSARHGRRIAAYFQATAAAGWRNLLVCSRPPADTAWLDPLERAGVEIVYAPRARSNFDARSIAHAFRLCRRVSCDVFHCDNTHTSPLIGAWLAGTRARVWTKHAMEPATEAGRAETLRDRAAISLRLSCRLASRTLAVSGAVRAELLRKGIAPARTAVVLLPADEPVAQAAPPSRETVRRMLDLPGDELVVTAVGRAAAVKGWDVLLEAFAALDGIPARLLLVGDAKAEPTFRARLDAIVARYRLGARVRFAGHVTDIDGILAASDIFVLPSRSEGYGLALVESLKAGLPSIAARVGGAPDIIDDMSNGVLFDRGDARALAALLRTLAADAALRERLGRAARTLRALPTPEAHAATLLSLYTELLTPQRRLAS